MQSSKRKRDRPEVSGPPPRRSSARGTPSQKELNLSTDDPGEKAVEINNSNLAPKDVATSDSAGQTGTVQNSSNTISDPATKSDVAVGESSTDPKAEIKKVAQHQNAPSTAVAPTQIPASVAAQEQQLIAIVAHRRLLLHRIRQSKAAVVTRLKQNPNFQDETKNGAASAGANTKQKADSNAANGGSTGATQSTAVHKEVEEFREMTKRAQQAAKKQKAEAEGHSEKRSSVSLRRGSSVGKRMNAALSSLAPGNSSTLGSEQAAAVPQHPPPAPLPTIPAVKAPPPPVVSQPPTTISSNAYVATKKLKTASSHAQITKLQQIQTHETGKGRRGSTPKGPKASMQNRSHAAQYHHYPPLPKHPGAFDHAMMRPQRPPVYCPEGMALRERMKGLTTKLNIIIDKKIERIQLQTKKLDPKLKAKSIGEQTLPFRRRTHWDNVLEEMRWLSADFIEERKWKASSARILSTAVATQRSSKKPVPQPEPVKTAPKQVVEPEPRPEKAAEVKSSKEEEQLKDEKKEETSKEEETPKKIDAEPKPQSLKSSADVLRIAESLFPKPVDDDAKSLKASARVISHMVSELWLGIEDAGSIHRAMKTHAAGLKRHLEFRKSELPMDTPPKPDDNSKIDETPKANDAPKNPVTVVQPKDVDSEKDATSSSAGIVSPDEGDAETQEKDATTEEIRIYSYDDMADEIQKQTDRIEKRLRQRTRAKSPYAKTVEPMLLPVEQKGYDFLDFIWSGNGAGGAILEDSLLIGAGEVVVSLLKHHRDEGPHLLLCPPEKSVSFVVGLFSANTGKSHRT